MKGKKYVSTLTEVKEAAVQSTDLLLCEMIPVVRMEDVTQQTQLLAVAKFHNEVSKLTMGGVRRV